MHNGKNTNEYLTRGGVTTTLEPFSLVPHWGFWDLESIEKRGSSLDLKNEEKNKQLTWS